MAVTPATDGEAGTGAPCPFLLRWLPLAALGLCVLVLLPRQCSDLWFDELVTLEDCLSAPSVLRCFTEYPYPNNHPLFSAITWCWMRLAPSTLEPFLRFPSLLIALATVGWMIFRWRRLLGAELALLAAFLFAASPVFAAFAYDIRGYGLSVLLGAVAAGCAVELAENPERRRSLFLCSISCLLLPLVMPTNLMLPPVLCLFLLWHGIAARRPLDWHLRTVLPPAGAAVLGGAYYWLIRNQVATAMRQGHGLDSAWAAAGQVVVGFAVHALPVLVLLLVLRFSRRTVTPVAADAEKRGGLRLLVCCGIAITSVLCVLPRAPFARTFLVLFPALTLGLFLCLRPWFWQGCAAKLFWRLILATCLCGILAGKAADALTRQQVAAGGCPHNLLQQGERGDFAVSRTVDFLATPPDPGRFWLIVPDVDRLSFRYYWRAVQPPVGAGRIMGCCEIPALRRELMAAPPPPVLFIAVNTAEQACQVLAELGLPQVPVPIFNSGRLLVYRVNLRMD